MRDNRTRARILAVTRERLQQEDGINALTVSQIAEAANVSRATLYRYFPDKAALLRAAGVTREQLSSRTTTRERILEATIEIVGERGLHNTTFEEIASRVGLSVSGLHWHYKTKDDLFADVGQNLPFVSSVAEEVVRAEAEESDIEAQLTRLVTVLLAEVTKRRAAVRYILFEADVYPEVARLALQHSVGRAFPLLVRLFEHHERKGTLRPGSAQARAQTFLGMLLVLILLRPAFTSLLATDDQETAREYIEILLHGIMAKSEDE